jgi:two-component system, NtrC family, sensor kinase
LWGKGKVLQSRALTIRLIRLAMAAALIFPILLFSLASWTSYRNIRAWADERLTRSLDIQQEEATKTFELIDLTMSRAAELVEGLDAATIRSDEDRLHSRVADLSHAVKVVQSIWIYSQ